MGNATFFDRQASLRRLTVRLAILTIIGSVGVACIGGVVSGLAYWQNAQATTGIVDPADLQRSAAIGAAVTVSFTAIAMVSQWLMLRFSTSPARRFFHARDLSDESLQPALWPQERQLVNVSGEMTIAAAIPQPRLYVLSEDLTINSFALGRTNGQAIVGVTAGALAQLTRDELQALIAHEHAHIANGDAVVNGRLLVLVRGFRAIYDASVAVIGAPLRHIKAANVAFAITLWLSIAFGVFFVLGLVGVGIARLMQAAIARQREYLADASAVQFTRATSGLLGALQKAGEVQQSRKHRPTHAAAFMMFVSPYRSKWLLRTHPKTAKRIDAARAMTPGRPALQTA